jgi:hypothetical protein
VYVCGGGALLDPQPLSIAVSPAISSTSSIQSAALLTFRTRGNHSLPQERRQARNSSADGCP